jgi:hypothetical protein
LERRQVDMKNAKVLKARGKMIQSHTNNGKNKKAVYDMNKLMADPEALNMLNALAMSIHGK